MPLDKDVGMGQSQCVKSCDRSLNVVLLLLFLLRIQVTWFMQLLLVYIMHFNKVQDLHCHTLCDAKQASHASPFHLAETCFVYSNTWRAKSWVVASLSYSVCVVCSRSIMAWFVCFYAVLSLWHTKFPSVCTKSKAWSIPLVYVRAAMTTRIWKIWWLAPTISNFLLNHLSGTWL
jgi:hypothetical protein